MAKQEGFTKEYDFKENNVCIIKHKHGGHLRANPQNHEMCDHKGGLTDWSQWNISILDNGKIMQLQNLKTLKYLSIDKNATFINVGSDGGSLSRWIIHRQSPQHENDVNNDNKNNDNEKNINNDETNNNNNDSNHNENKNDKDDNNSNNNNENNTNGNTNPLVKAKSNSIVMFNNAPSNHGIKLENERCFGKFLCVRPHDGVCVSNGDSHYCELHFYIKGKSDDTLFKKPYLFKQKAIIIIRHAHDGSLRVNPNNNKLLDTHGEKEIESQWDAMPSETDSTAIQFCSVKTGHYIQIEEEEKISLTPKSGPYTQFKIHVIQEPNIVKLESDKFPGIFIRANSNGVNVGKGGPHCQLTLLAQD